MDECFAELTTAINRAAADGLQAPAGRLRAGSQGYLEYSRTVPLEYSIAGLTCAIVGRPVAGNGWPAGCCSRSSTDLDHFRVQRRDRAGGVIHEYRLVV
jgi:hypothetical protein